MEGISQHFNKELEDFLEVRGINIKDTVAVCTQIGVAELKNI